jgi:hypothetical protein
MRRHSILVGLLTLGLVACEGPTGPAGSPGATGPQGPPGPGTRVVLNAVVASDGSASAALPAAAGSLADPPSLTCYLNQPGTTVFLLVGTDLDGPVCALVQQGATTRGDRRRALGMERTLGGRLLSWGASRRPTHRRPEGARHSNQASATSAPPACRPLVEPGPWSRKTGRSPGWP